MDPTTRPNITTLVFPAGAVAWFIVWAYDGFKPAHWPPLGDAGVVAVTSLVTWVIQHWDRVSKREASHVLTKHGGEIRERG